MSQNTPYAGLNSKFLFSRPFFCSRPKSGAKNAMSCC